MKITVRCDGVEQAGSTADFELVHLSAKDRQPGDTEKSAAIKATIELRLTDVAERGQFEPGKNYTIDFVEAPATDGEQKPA